MFIVTTVEDVIQVPHEKLATPTVPAILHEIDQKYPNKVLYDVGLCVCRYDDDNDNDTTKPQPPSLLNVSHGVCVAGDGGSHHTCTFRLVIFRPFMEEVMLGRIAQSTPEGIHVSLGFFHDIFIPAYWMLRPSHYNESTGLWVWTPTYDEAEEDNVEESKEPLTVKEGTAEHLNGNKTIAGTNHFNGKEELTDVDANLNVVPIKVEEGTEEKIAIATKAEERGAETEENSYEMEIGSEIRFKVKSIHFTQITNTAKGMQATTTSTAQYKAATKADSSSSAAAAASSASAPFTMDEKPPANGNHGLMRRRRSSSVGLDQAQLPPVMHIVASICEDGLGLVSWWANQEEEEEEEEEQGEDLDGDFQMKTDFDDFDEGEYMEDYEDMSKMMNGS